MSANTTESAKSAGIPANQRIVKSRGKPASDKQTEAAHHTSFANLHDVIEKKYGIPGDEIPYWDPYGHMDIGGTQKSINLKSQMMDFWRPVFDEMNEMMRADRRTNFGYAAEKAIEKQVGRSSFSVPIFFTPDVHRTSTEDTPFADTIPRVAVAEDTIKLDEETDLGVSSSFDGESAESWPENDDTYTSHTYDVYSYGRQNAVSDFVQLAAQGLRSTRALTEEAQVASIRQYEERQFLIGRATNLDTSGSVAANDSDGFLGLPDIISGSEVSDATGGSMTIQKVRQANKTLRREARASRENIVHFTDHTTFEDMKSDLTEFTRYDSPSDTLDFGFDAIVIDNTPIMETHALPDTDGDRIFASVDMSSHYAGMLQDVTMHPLARDSPEETFAVDAYGALVGRTDIGAHYYENLA